MRKQCSPEQLFLEKAQGKLPKGFTIVRHTVLNGDKYKLSQAFATAEKVRRSKNFFSKRTIYITAYLISGRGSGPDWKINIER